MKEEKPEIKLIVPCRGFYLSQLEERALIDEIIQLVKVPAHWLGREPHPKKKSP